MDPDRLDALLADAVAEQAGRARSAERMLRQAAEESATFLGTLVELAERREPLTLRTASGRSYRGVVVAVGRDFVVVRDGEKPPVFVATRSLGSVRTARSVRHDTSGDRAPPLDASFAAVLAGLAAERPGIHLSVAGADGPILGDLRAVGRDVVTVSVEAPSRPTVYVPTAAIEAVVVLDS